MKLSSSIKNKCNILIFILPALIPLFVFWLIPILVSLGISFTNWDYMTPRFQIVGLDNYLNLIKDSGFQKAFKQTLLFSLETVIPTMVLAILIALLIHSLNNGKRYAAILFSPWVTPTVAISIVWAWIFEPDKGLANQLLAFFGASPQPWISSSNTALISVALVTIWKNSGYITLFFLGALAKVPTELYDAASVDGGNAFTRFRYITLPLISPTTFMVSIMLTIESLRAYDQIQILTQGGPSGSTRTLLYLYYQLAFEHFSMGQAAAAAVLLLVIAVILSLIQSRIGKELIYYE